MIRPVPATSHSHGYAGQLDGPGDNVQKLGQSIYTRYLLPFEMTAALLVIAVVAAVVLSRRQEPAAGEMSRAEQEEVTQPNERSRGLVSGAGGRPVRRSAPPACWSGATCSSCSCASS